MTDGAEQSAQLVNGFVLFDDGLDGTLLDHLQLLIDPLLLDLHPLQDRGQFAVVALIQQRVQRRTGRLDPAGLSHSPQQLLVWGSARRHVLFVYEHRIEFLIDCLSLLRNYC